MRLRALENIRAARELIDATKRCPNAASSRSYYAVYHAGWWRLREEGYEVPERRGKNYWPHEGFWDELVRGAGLDEESASALRWLYSLRIRADYYPDGVEVEEAVQAVGEAERVLDMLNARVSSE